jgi:hypothetical protein
LKISREPHRRQLQREPQPVGVPAPIGDQLSIFIIQEEEPLKLLPRWCAIEPSIRRHLPRGQETLLVTTVGHGRSTYAPLTTITASRPAQPP